MKANKAAALLQLPAAAVVLTRLTAAAIAWRCSCYGHVLIPIANHAGSELTQPAAAVAAGAGTQLILTARMSDICFEPTLSAPTINALS